MLRACNKKRSLTRTWTRFCVSGGHFEYCLQKSWSHAVLVEALMDHCGEKAWGKFCCLWLRSCSFVSERHEMQVKWPKYIIIFMNNGMNVKTVLAGVILVAFGIVENVCWFVMSTCLWVTMLTFGVTVFNVTCVNMFALGEWFLHVF